MWAIPGALLLIAGGSGKQLALSSDRSPCSQSAAGWPVAVGTVTRLIAKRVLSEERSKHLQVFASGVITGDAIFTFAFITIKSFRK
ncbi:hypothetical protein [Paraburkholderia silvatlantica]|uniref:Uncharacterized protein n=1 Tax=Paraburkholderia silvatlantica TaxID=321895 RepID=A0ABR6FVI7_9BURK|nr:hypothetical protein [Paraburkholderia silvatlantica]MBB2931459.1 hypothetical protein [Paraburkholderia silvatlantica]